MTDIIVSRHIYRKLDEIFNSLNTEQVQECIRYLESKLKERKYDLYSVRQWINLTKKQEEKTKMMEEVIINLKLIQEELGSLFNMLLKDKGFNQEIVDRIMDIINENIFEST